MELVFLFSKTLGQRNLVFFFEQAESFFHWLRNHLCRGRVEFILSFTKYDFEEGGFFKHDKQFTKLKRDLLFKNRARKKQFDNFYFNQLVIYSISQRYLLSSFPKPSL